MYITRTDHSGEALTQNDIRDVAIRSLDSVIHLQKDTFSRTDSAKTHRDMSSSEEDLLTDVRITKIIRILQSSFKEIRGDTLAVRRVFMELFGIRQRQKPGAVDTGPPNPFIKAMVAEGLSQNQLQQSAFAIFSAYSVIAIERKQGVEHSKEARVNARLSPKQIDRVRKRFTEIDSLVRQGKKAAGLPEEP